MYKVQISGTGLYTPKEKISNEELVQSFNKYVDEFNEINSEDIISLSINGSKFDDTNELYIKDKPKLLDAYLKFIPYYLWSNRGENEMLVWVNEN